MTAYTRKTVPGQTYLYIEETTDADPDSMAREMQRAFTDITAFMQDKGIKPSGPALSLYPSFEMAPMTFRSGFFVTEADAALASDPVKSGTTPKGEVVTMTHTGPYTALAATYKTLMEALQHDGLTFVSPTWEVYLNTPDETAPEDLKTEIFVTIAT